MNLGIKGFFDDISNFLKSGTVLGVDIGTVSVKIAEISKKKETFRLENYCILEARDYLQHSNQAIQTSSLKIVEKEAAALLRVAVKELNTKTKTSMASIPAYSAFVTFLDMPILSPQETAKSIMFQARQYIPLPASDVSIEWQKVEEFEGPRGGRFQRVLLVGIPNEVIAKYKNIFKMAGLELKALELDSYAIMRVLGSREEGPLMVVDMGAELTSMMVIENGLLKYAGEADYGGVYLTQAVSRGLEISVFRAEELKKRRGLSKAGADSELSTLILPFLDVIIQECGRALKAFEDRYKKQIKKIVLLGSSANLIGVGEYMKAQLNLPVTFPSALTKIEHSLELEPVTKELNNDLSLAIGLTMKYFE